MAKNQKKPITTKKHLARLERERRQTRFIVIGSVIVLVVVVIVLLIGTFNQVGYKALNKTFLPSLLPVASVNGDSIKASTWEAQTRYARYSTIRNAQQLIQLAQIFGSDPSTGSSFLQQLQQTVTQLDPVTMGQQVMDQMINDKLIRQEATRRGIVVSPEDVDKAFQAAFGYYPNGTPTPTATNPGSLTSTLSPLQMTLVPPSPTPTATATLTATTTVSGTAKVTSTLLPAGTNTSSPTDTNTPAPTGTNMPPSTGAGTLEPTENGTSSPTNTSMPSPTNTSTPSPTNTNTPMPTATFTLTPSLTPSATQVLTPTLTSTPAPTATPYTQQGYENLKATTIANFQKEDQVSESDLRFLIESALYRQKVMDAVLTDEGVSQMEDQVWARHILVADETTANEVEAKVREPNANWYELANKYSTDPGSKNSGGDLGWFGKGKMIAEFEQAAFGLGVGEISQPIKTQYGYHIIQSLGLESRPISDQDYQSLRSQKFQDWLTAQKDKAKIVTHDWWKKIAPDQPALPADTLNTISQMIQQQQQQQQFPGLTQPTTTP
jgi:peptidyl-prolyl cis-trans isomerase D